jgi:hypothetical protein
MGHNAEQKILPNTKESTKNNATAPPVIPTPTARAENCKLSISPNGAAVRTIRK